MSGIGVLCFAASYAIAFCLEAARAYWNSPLRTGLALCWTVAGIVAHTAYLYFHHAVTVATVDGSRSYFLVTAWGLAIACLYLSCFHSRKPLCLLIWPIILLLIFGGVVFPETKTPATLDPFPFDTAMLWRRLHTGSFFLATLTVCLGFASGMMYLLQDGRLRKKRRSGLQFSLPTLEWSLTQCRRSIGASIFLLGICIFSGVVMRAERNTFLYWNDPLIVGTSLLFAFLVLFSGSLLFRRWKTEGRRVAVLTLLAFLFLVAILLLGVFFTNAHWQNASPRQHDDVGIVVRNDSTCSHSLLVTSHSSPEVRA